MFTYIQVLNGFYSSKKVKNIMRRDGIEKAHRQNEMTINFSFTTSIKLFKFHLQQILSSSMHTYMYSVYYTFKKR